MNKLVGDNTGHSLLVVGRRLVLVIQQVGLPVGDEAPVLHGTSTEVRDGYLIWIKTAQRRSPLKKLFLIWFIAPLIVLLTTFNFAIKVGQLILLHLLWCNCKYYQVNSDQVMF